MRFAVAVSVFVALLMFAGPLDKAEAGAARECQQRATTPYSVKRLVICAAPKIGASTSHALYIAHRESRFQPWAKNPGSSACGVFQIVHGTWYGSMVRYDYGSLIDSTPFYWQCKNGRANVFLALRYMAHQGYGPWGG